MADFELRPGMLIGSRHRLESLLAVGGSSEVWTATHALTGGTVALKILKAGRPDDVRRFVREARIAATLEHPHVVRVLDILELSSTRPAMVIELLRGETLAERLSRGPLTLQELARIFLPVVDAVRQAHRRGIVHRDLKPANIFLCNDGARSVKVLDFGIAKLRGPDGEGELDASLRTETGVTIGTPHYMAPEQVFGDADVDGGVDVWALGVCFYECLSGVRPFEGESYGQIFKQIALGDAVPLRDLAPETPEGFARLVHAMLSRDRALRVQNLDQVEDALSVALPANAASVAPPPPPPPLPRARLSTPLRALAAALALVAGLTTALGWHLRTERASPIDGAGPVTSGTLATANGSPLTTTHAATVKGFAPARATSEADLTAAATPPSADAHGADAHVAARAAASSAARETVGKPKANRGQRPTRTPSPTPASSSLELPGGVSGQSPY